MATEADIPEFIHTTVTDTDREVDLVGKTSVPSVFEKESEEEILHESEKITTGVTEATTTEELDSVNIKHGQVSEFEESTNVELQTPTVSDGTDIPAAKILRDLILEQNPEEPHATLSSEHAVLTTKEVHDDEQHIPAGKTEEGVTESGNREADVAELSHTEKVENFDDEKFLNVKVEKDTPEDTVKLTSNESYQKSAETEQASQETEPSATNIETSIKEDAELSKKSVELKTGETIQEAEVSKNQDSVETQEQPSSDFEQVTEEKTNEGIPLSDDIDDTTKIPRDFDLGENKTTEILTEAKEGADESEEKPGDDMQQETCDTSSNIEDATVERSSVHTTEKNLEDSATVLLEEHNHVTAEESNSAHESKEKVETSPVSTYTPSSADTTDDRLLQEQIEQESPKDGTYLVSLDTKENSINDEFSEEGKKPVTDAPKEALDTSLEIESVTIEQVKDPELTENPEVTAYNEEKTISEVVEYGNNRSYSDTDTSKVTPADETSEHRVEKEIGEEILHEPETVTTGVTEEAVPPPESDCADVKDANVLESDENKNVEILTPEISDERAVSPGEVPHDLVLEQDHKESYATSSSEHKSKNTEISSEFETTIPSEFDLGKTKNTEISTEATEEADESEVKPDNDVKEETYVTSSIIEDEGEVVTVERSPVYTTEKNLEDSSNNLLEAHSQVTTEASETANATEAVEDSELKENPEVTTYTDTEIPRDIILEQEPKESYATSISDNAVLTAEEELDGEQQVPAQHTEEGIHESGNLESLKISEADEVTDFSNTKQVEKSLDVEAEKDKPEDAVNKTSSEVGFEETEQAIQEQEYSATDVETSIKEDAELYIKAVELKETTEEAEIPETDCTSTIAEENKEHVETLEQASSEFEPVAEEKTNDTVSLSDDIAVTSTVVLKENQSTEILTEAKEELNEKALESVLGEDVEKSEERETTEQQNVTEITELEAEEHQSGTANESITDEIIDKEIARDSAVRSPDTEIVGKDVEQAEEYSKVKNYQELDSTTNAVQNEELSEVLQSASLDENKQEQVLTNKESLEEEKMSDATEALDTGATALNEEVKHEEEKESTISKKALNIPNVEEDAQVEAAAPKVLQEVEEICQGVPKEPVQEKLEAKDMNTDVEEKNIDISESLKDGEKLDIATRELIFDAHDIIDDLNLKEQSISPNEEPGNIISENQIATTEIIPEEIKFNKNETELTRDKEKVEEFDEPKMDSTLSAYSDTKTQDQSNVESHVNDSSVKNTESNRVDLVSDKDVPVKSYPEVQQVPEKQVIQESEAIKSAKAPAIEPGKTQTEESREVDRSLIIEQKETKEITTPVEEENEDEHERVDSGSDGPVMVEASTDVVEKAVPCKKSHNILSGVGSKVKHSIAKVRKVITGKSSHPKPSSPK